MHARAAGRIERENREQLTTIAKLYKSLSLDSVAGDLAIDHLSLLITSTPPPDATTRPHASQIHELETQLASKRDEYRFLTLKLDAYLAEASAGERELLRQQAEKNALIQAFQQQAPDDTGPATLSRLDAATLEKEMERARLQKASDDAREMCVAARDRLKTTYDLTRDLQQELGQLQKRLKSVQGRASQMDTIRANEAVIQERKVELRQLKAQIKSLTEANVLLRKLIA
jgi:hypothetical protein